MTPQDIVKYLSFLVLSSNVFFVFLAGLYILKGIHPGMSRLWNNYSKLLNLNAVRLAFLVSLVSTLGSLYFSEIAKFEPCKLCWVQRIFMYPLVIILAVSLYKKLADVYYYVLPLTFIGMLLAGYHYYLQNSPNPLAPCSSIGFSVSCSDRFTTSYGYITIPWMAFSSFILIFFLMLVKTGRIK